MFKIIRKFFLRFLYLLLISGFLVLMLPRLITYLNTLGRIYQVDEVPAQPVGIVFGAGLWRDGSPTPVLRDRVATAAQLYFSGKVGKLLMSGDNLTDSYDEPGAMRAYAESLGVPQDAIVLDYAGTRTYDTCYRAREIFNVQNAILVTQGFHLPRALYTCNALGVEAVGVPADRRTYRRPSLVWWNMREVPASLVALLDVHLTRPVPLLENPDPIYPDQAQ